MGAYVGVLELPLMMQWTAPAVGISFDFSKGLLVAINPRRRAGQSFSTLPPISDINLLGDVQGVVHLDPRESYRTRRRAVSVFWCPRVPVRPHESLRAGKLARLADFAGYLTSHRHSNGVSHLKGAANSGGLHHDW